MTAANIYWQIFYRSWKLSTKISKF